MNQAKATQAGRRRSPGWGPAFVSLTTFLGLLIAGLVGAILLFLNLARGVAAGALGVLLAEFAAYVSAVCLLGAALLGLSLLVIAAQVPLLYWPLSPALRLLGGLALDAWALLGAR